MTYWYLSTHKDIMTYRLKGNSPYALRYNKGLEDEQTVLDFLEAAGHQVEAVDGPEQFSDIDCYLDGTPTSIKCLHKGAKYGHLLVELATQRGRSVWPEDAFEEVKHLLGYYTVWIREPGSAMASLAVNSFTEETWKPGWWYLSKAEQYLIWQGDRLLLYKKADWAFYILSKGFLHVKALSPKILSEQQGKQTVSGYFPTGAIKPIWEKALAYG